MSDFGTYQELILDLLEKNSNEIKELKKEVNAQLSEIKEEVSRLRQAKQMLIDQKNWKDRVDDVWSPPQMKESKDEIYTQKGKWAVGYGVFIAAQILWIVYTYFNNK